MQNQPGIGQQYQEATKHTRERLSRHQMRAPQEPAYKQYSNPLAILPLPKPQTTGGAGLWETISERRSERDFLPAPMTLAQLSQLLWATQGVTGRRGTHLFRATASAGALYPNDTFLFVNRVQGCPPGVWHYQVPDHNLAQLTAGDMGESVAVACLYQEFCAEAAVVFAWAATVERAAWKYGDRCYRYLHLDAGHLGSQLQLAAKALGLGSVNIGAFFDDEVNNLLGLDGQTETIIYLTAVGKPI